MVQEIKDTMQELIVKCSKHEEITLDQIKQYPMQVSFYTAKQFSRLNWWGFHFVSKQIEYNHASKIDCFSHKLQKKEEE